MDLLRLDLIAYGPFSQRTLDLSQAPRALHVIYGPNEAGKSTALRALCGLLFGIPRTTRDDHKFEARELRVGGLLANGGAEPLYVVRRKGNDKTLLDDAGRPVDEVPLAKMLAGVTAESFQTMFGIDHESLRKGGEALVEGHGEVGQSLLGAALGSTAVQALLARLRDGAEALWVPQGHKRPLNEALKAYAEAQRTALSPTTVETWLAQKRGIEQGVERARELGRELAAAREELAAHKRLMAALPLLEDRRVLSARCEGFAGTRILPAAAGRDREQAIADLREASEQQASLRGAIAAHEAKRAALSVSSAPAEGVLDDVAEAVGGRLAGYGESLDEIAAMDEQIERLGAETRAALGRLEGLVSAQAAADQAVLGRLRLSAAKQKQLRNTAGERAALEAAVHRLEGELATRRREMEAARRAVSSSAEPADTRELARTVARVRKLGDVERAAAIRADEAARRTASCRADAVALGLADVALEEIESLQVPLAETVDRFARELDDLERTETAEREAERRAAAKLGEVKLEIEALERAGSVPTEAELLEARARRHDAWARVRERVDRGGAKRSGKGSEPAEDVRDFEDAMRAADDAADRLRREAERASALARLLAERTAAEAERGAAAVRANDALVRRKQADAAWRDVLARGRLPERSPVEARAWLTRHAALVTAARSARETADEARRLAADAQRAKADIAAALAHAGEPLAARDVEREPLDSLLDRADARVLEVQAAARARADATREAERAEAEASRMEGALEESRAALAAWRDRWADLLAALPLSHETSPEEMLGVLAEASDLFPKLDELARTTHRRDRLRADVAAFETSVRDLAVSRAPELGKLPVAAAAEELVRRARQEEIDRVEAAHLERTLADAQTRLAEETARAERAHARLTDLMAAAGVTTLGELEQAERRSAELLELRRQLDDVEMKLLKASSGLSSDELEAQAAGCDPEALAVEIEERERQVEDLESSRHKAEREVGEKEAGLRQLEERSVAADGAAAAEQALAKVRRLAARWAELRLAAAVLEREIEAWRKDNQGPLLARASVLFERFTLGSFVRLAASFDDKDRHVLVGVRPDGREVPIEGMSDGTRDPLYLALRIASLERHAQAGETLPLVVDDVLVHLDDDRARAVLAALGELSSRAQVLFFTHHTRMLELAREVVPAERLVEHRLG